MSFRGRRFQFPPHRTISRLLQVAIAGMLIVGIIRVNLAVVVNAGLSLCVTFLPAILRRDFNLQLDPWMSLWITGTLFLHTLGMFGFYDQFWWFDHVTHTLSATIVASIGYVTAYSVDRWTDAISLPSRFLFVFILLFTIALGVLWELAEFVARLVTLQMGLDPVLVQYGLEDTLLDLVFDAVGAIVVAAFGTRSVATVVESLLNRREESRERTGTHRSDRLGADDHVQFTQFISSGPGNARRSWALVFFLIAVVVGGITAGAFVSSLLVGSVLVLAVVPAVVNRTPRAMLPWPLLAIATLPVAGAVFGGSWLTSNFVTYFAVATIALVIVVELHLFTPVRMTPRFAVLLVVITTVAATGMWAVGRWLADLFLGTELLLVSGQSDAAIETALMFEFLHASLAGLVAGLVFEWQFRQPVG